MGIYQPQNGDVLSPTKAAAGVCVAREAAELFLGPLLAARGLVYEIHAFEKVTLKLVQPEDKLVLDGKEVDCVCFTGEAKVFAFLDQYCVVTQSVKDDQIEQVAEQDAKPPVIKKTRARKAKATGSKTSEPKASDSKE